MSIEFFQIYEDYTYTQKNVLYIGNPDHLYPYSKLDRINLIEQIAREEKVNLFQTNYDVNQDGSLIPTLYYAIGDPTLYQMKFKMLEGEVDTFNPFNKIQVAPFSKTAKVQSKTMIGIESNDKTRLNAAITRLTSDEIELSKVDLVKNNFIGISEGVFRSNIFRDIAILLLLLLPTTYYYYYSRLQEVYVKKSLGYSKNEIIRELVQDIFKIQVKSLGLVSLVQFVYLKFYNDYSCFFKYLIFYICITLVLLIVLIIYNVICLNFMKLSKISLGIKQKKPLLLPILFNIIFKISSIILTLFLLLSSIANYKDIALIVKNENKWEILKNYNDYNFGYISEYPTEDQLLNEYNACNKAQKLFISAEKNGGILIDSSRYKHSISNWNGNILVVNKNYLSLETLRDVHGKIIDIKKFDDNEITVLLPTKYSDDESEIKKEAAKYFNGMRYFLGDAYAKKQGLEPIPKEYYEVNIEYIENGQSLFMFKPNANNEAMNNAMDPIICIVNGNILGNALCLSSMTSGDFKAFIGSDAYTVEYLLKDIERNDAADMIVPYNSYFNNVSSYLLKLKTKLYVYNFLFFIGCVALGCIIIVSHLMFVERNNKKIYIQKIHGHSFYSIYKNYFIYMVVTDALILTMVSQLVNQEIMVFSAVYLMGSIFITYVTLLQSTTQLISRRER